MFSFFNSFPKVTKLHVIFNCAYKGTHSYFDTGCCAILARSGRYSKVCYIHSWLTNDYRSKYKVTQQETLMTT